MKTKRIYFKYLFQFVAFLLLPVLFASTLYKTSIEQAEHECIESSFSDLKNVRDEFDNYTKALDQVATQIMFEPQLSRMARQVRPEYGSSHVYDIGEFAASLKNRMSSSPYIDTSFILLLKDVAAAYYNGYAVFDLRFFYDNVLNYSQMDYQQWMDRVFSGDTPFFIPAQTIYYQEQKINALTYVFPISFGLNINRNLLFFINEKKMMDFCRNGETGGEYNIYISDERGNPLFESTSFPFEYSLLPEPTSPGEEYFFYRANGEKYMVVTLGSSHRDVYFTSVIPQSVAMEKVTYIRKMTMALVFVYLIIGGASALSLAKFNSKPMDDIACSLEPLLNRLNNSGEPEQESELDYIKTGVSYLIEYSENMLDTVQQRNNELKDIFLGRLFTGSFLSLEEILDSGDRLKLDLRGREYCSVVLEIAKEFSDENTGRLEASSPLLNRIVPYLPETVLHAAMNQRQIGLLLILREERHQDLSVIGGWVGPIREKLLIKEGINVSAGIGNIVSSLDEVQFSYEQAMFALANHDSSPIGIYPYEGSSNSKLINIFFYPIEMEHKLMNCIKAGDQSSVLLIMDLLKKENTLNRNLSQKVGRILLGNLQSTLLKASSELDLDPESLQKIRRINLNLPLQIVLNELKDMFLDLSLRYAEKRKSQRQYIGEKAINFIHQNYNNPMMGIPMMAELFDYSESYFSQFFKEYTGHTFSSFLEQYRMTKAKELMDEGKYQIEKIATMVGYYNSNTFRRAFNRVEGISPSAYRSNKRVTL